MSDLRSQSGTPADELPTITPIKLLFDQNLSPRLSRALADVYPGAAHVRDFSLQRADDQTVWDFAKANGFTIVSKDNDFHHLSFVRGAPPRVIWLALGNCSTAQIEDVLRTNVLRVIAFHRDPASSFLILR